MDMSMDMGTNMFQTANMALARTYWYMIAGVMGALFAVQTINSYLARTRYALPLRAPEGGPSDALAQVARLRLAVEAVPHEADRRLLPDMGYRDSSRPRDELSAVAHSRALLLLGDAAAPGADPHLARVLGRRDGLHDLGRHRLGRRVLGAHRLPQCVGDGHPAPPALPPGVQVVHAGADCWDILRAAELAAPLAGEDHVCHGIRPWLALLPGIF